MLADSGLLQDLEAYAFSPAGLPMCIYGDPAYPLRVHLQGPFRNPHLNPLMEAFNASMSSVRISVEWLFGDLKIENWKEQHWQNVYCLCTAAQCPHLPLWQ